MRMVRGAGLTHSLTHPYDDGGLGGDLYASLHVLAAHVQRLRHVRHEQGHLHAHTGPTHPYSIIIIIIIIIVNIFTATTTSKK